MRKFLIVMLLLVGFVGCSALETNAQTTEFTYQGSLKDNSAPANTNYDFEFDAIPFPSHVKSISTVGSANSFDFFQKDAGLTIDQTRQLKLLESESSLSILDKQNKYKRMPEFSTALNERAFNEMRRILTKEQLLRVARLQARGEFKMNPLAPLSRSEFVAFLELSASEIEYVRSVAKNETDRHITDVRNLNKTTFEQLTATLPETAQAKMRHLFENVWVE